MSRFDRDRLTRELLDDLIGQGPAGREHLLATAREAVKVAPLPLVDTVAQVLQVERGGDYPDPLVQPHWADLARHILFGTTGA